MTDYLARALRRLRVEVHVGAEVTPDALDAIDADIILLATGSRPALSRAGLNPAVTAQESSAGLDHFNAVAIAALDESLVASVDDVLSERRQAGQRALVIDGRGDWEGAGTAEFLSNGGSEVVVVSAAATVGASLEPANCHLFHQRAAAKGIRLVSRNRLAGCKDGTVQLKHTYTGEMSEIADVDLIVPAVGRRSEESLYLDWKSRAGSRRLYRVGDCVAPRMLREVIRESYEFALTV